MGENTQQVARDSLRSAERIPIAQLQPSISESQDPAAAAPSRAVEGEVTITWPFSIVTKSIAFKLVESDFRLRLNKGQVRVDFYGPAAQAVAKAAIGGGDEVRIGLEGVQWVKATTPSRPDTLEWQLKFTNRISLLVRRAETKEEVVVSVDGEGDESAAGDLEQQPQPQPQTLPLSSTAAEILRPSTPENTDFRNDEIPLPRTAAPFFPAKRLASSAFDVDEYASPAFIKRARVSYGSLFEGGLDPFEDDERPRKLGKKKSSRFSMHASWRYASRSPSPEPENQPEQLEEEADKESEDESLNNQAVHANGSSPTPLPMVDEACQTQPALAEEPEPTRIAPDGDPAPRPDMGAPTIPDIPSEIIATGTNFVPTFMPEGLAATSAPQSPSPVPGNSIPEPAQQLPIPLFESHTPHEEQIHVPADSLEHHQHNPFPSYLPAPHSRISEDVHHEDDVHGGATAAEDVDSHQDLGIDADPSLTDFPRHLHEDPNFAPSQLEQAPWATLTSLPPQVQPPVPEYSNLDNPVEIIDSSSPPRAPSPEVLQGPADFEDGQPEVPVHADEGREAEAMDTHEAGFRHIEAPSADSEPEQMQDQAEEWGSGDDEMQDDIGSNEDADADADGDDVDVPGEDYDLRNYDRAQDDDVVELVESSDEAVDRNDPDEQAVDFEREDEAQSENEEADSQVSGFHENSMIPVTQEEETGPTGSYDEEEGYEEEEESDAEGEEENGYHKEEEDYDEEEADYDSYDEDEELEEEDEEDEEEEQQPAKPAASSSGPTFISLLSDSEDEDSGEVPPPAQRELPPADERDPFQPVKPLAEENKNKSEEELDVEDDDRKDEEDTNIERVDTELAPSAESLVETATAPGDIKKDDESMKQEDPAELQAQSTTSYREAAQPDISQQQPTGAIEAEPEQMDVDEPEQTEPQAEPAEATPAEDEDAMDLVPSVAKSVPEHPDGLEIAREEASVSEHDGEPQEELKVPKEKESSLDQSTTLVEEGDPASYTEADGSQHEPAADRAADSQVPVADNSSSDATQTVLEKSSAVDTLDSTTEPTTKLTIESAQENFEAESGKLKVEKVETATVVDAPAEEAADLVDKEVEGSSLLEGPEISITKPTSPPKISEVGAASPEPAVISGKENQLVKDIEPQTEETEEIKDRVSATEEPKQFFTPEGTDTGLHIGEEEDSDSEMEHSFAAEQQIMTESQAYDSTQPTEAEAEHVQETVEPTKEPSEAGSQVTTRSRSKAKAAERDILITVQSLRSWDRKKSPSSIVTDDDPSIALGKATPELQSRPRTPQPTQSQTGEDKAEENTFHTPPTVRVTRSQTEDGDPSSQLANKTVTPKKRRTRQDAAKNKATPEPRETRAMSQRLRSKTPEPNTQPEPRETRAMSQRLRSKTPEPNAQLQTGSPATPKATATAAAAAVAGSTPTKEDEQKQEQEQAASIKKELTKMLRTDLPDYFSLKTLRNSLNKTGDLMGVAARDPKQPFRPKGGARDWMLEIPLAQPDGGAPGTVCSATLFRPNKASLPRVREGDVVLLRRVSVVSLKGRGFGVRSGDGSAWAVFEKDDGEMLPQIKGPPIEDISNQETAYAEGLRRWWGAVSLDEKALGKMGKATDKALSKDK